MVGVEITKAAVKDAWESVKDSAISPRKGTHSLLLAVNQKRAPNSSSRRVVPHLGLESQVTMAPTLRHNKHGYNALTNTMLILSCLREMPMS